MTVATGPNHPDLRMFAPLDAAPGRRMSPQSVGIAVALNVAIVLLALLQLHRTLGLPPHPGGTFLSEPLVIPPSLLKFKTDDGGGGSNNGATPVSLGNPPKFSATPLVPLTAPQIVHPALAVDPAISVRTDLNMTRPDLTKMGLLTGADMPNASPGNKGGDGLGNGRDHGVGDGGPTGTGIGSTGGHGGPMIAPQVLFAPEPEFSETARKNKVSGYVLVALTIDATGRPTDIHVVHGLGSGLDEKAVEAVSHYKFKPAMQNGHPVPVAMNVNVDFQIF